MTFFNEVFVVSSVLLNSIRNVMHYKKRRELNPHHQLP
jgi:hypothetical protein